MTAGGILTAQDLYLLGEGSHFRLYRHLGAHLTERDGVGGTAFAVWAPNAEDVSVIGDFNGWNARRHPLEATGVSGVWQGFVPEVAAGARYKYHIRSRHGRYEVDKADPIAFRAEESPGQASIVWPLDYEWGDGAWMDARRARSRSVSRCRSTRCTSDPGGASPRTVTGCSPIANWPTSWWSIWPTRASRTWSSCRSWNIRSTDRGATRRRDTSLRRAATGRHRTACTSSTGSISTGSA